MADDGISRVERYGEKDSLRERGLQPASQAEADWPGMKWYPNSAGETIMNISDNSVGVPAGLSFRKDNLYAKRV